MFNSDNDILISEEEQASDLLCEDEGEEEDIEYPISQYDLTAAPNDFNILTIFQFIESGSVKIPGFQRNYVWDIKRASKLIESLIIGLPVPQIFLYEETRNKFLVIDGQQRLMSIYYFIKQRFPRKEKRAELRRIFEKYSNIPDEKLHDDTFFSKFNLFLPEQSPNQPNKFSGLNYSTLGEYKSSFDLRTIRNVIVKQILPKDDDSAIYEVFNRLNSGGINLAPQEIRMSLYHSNFLEMLSHLNIKAGWRRLLGVDEPDLHMKDVEILLRSFTMLINGNNYVPSMLKFLNGFARDSGKFTSETISYLEVLFDSFLSSCSELSREFYSTANRFSVTLFESVFTAVCFEPYTHKRLITGKLDLNSIANLKKDDEFLIAAKGKTTNTKNVKGRLTRAKQIVKVG
ncbi:MAG: DUF262 domain-containing protein [bacterium]